MKTAPNFQLMILNCHIQPSTKEMAMARWCVLACLLYKIAAIVHTSAADATPPSDMNRSCDAHAGTIVAPDSNAAEM